jgi:hypothetical protein
MWNGMRGLGQAFEEEIKKMERKKAAEEMDKLREKSKIKWDGVEEIRKWRESLLYMNCLQIS